MGQIDDIYETGMSSDYRLPCNVVVFGSATALAGLLGLDDALRLVQLAPHAAIPAEEIARADLVVVEIDPSSAESLDRLDRLHRTQPDLPVIAALANVDLATTRALLRRGIVDVLSLPFRVEEFLNSVLEVGAEASAKSKSRSTLAPLISVLKSSGGSGATTIATHLAAGMARAKGPQARACVIDLDLQNGDVASYLGQQATLTIADLFEADKRLDEELFRSVSVERSAQVDLISAPHDIIPIEAVSFDKAMKVIEIARARYEFVIIDLPGALTNWALSLVLASDQIVLVGQLSLQSLRHAKRRLELLRSMGMESSAVQIVMNRVRKKMFKSIDVSDASTAINHPILATICDDDALVQTAQDQGEWADTIQSRNRFSRDIDSLAAAMVAKLTVES